MNLVELLSVLPDSSFPAAANDLEIAGISADSRSVRPGDLFVAVRGAHADGRDHAREAVLRGASAVISDRPAPEGLTVPWIRVPSPRRALGWLSSRLAGDPAEKLVLAAVTGTNGKTTTALLLESILARRYGRSGFVGTVLYRTGRREIPAGQTTPEAPVLQQLLAEMVDAGIPAAAMEVSSHALALDRVEGCRFDVAVFTNLTRDHLDFHGDLESYFDAKKRLFDDFRKPGAAAVVNVDDPAGRRLARSTAAPVVTWSVEGAPGADVRAEHVRCDLSGTSLAVVHAGARFTISSALVGRFNADNLLGAAAAGLALGFSETEIAGGIAAVTRVPGRLERVEAGQPYAILVDYAHTEDALKRLLEAVRGLTGAKIILVFGCGGDRDRGKRVPMGRVAGSMSDFAIATSDNPRSEDPEAILAEVEKGLALSGATNYRTIPDRREAIRTAIDLASPGTVVVIAGKGHERVQVIGNRTIPFDDREVAAGYASRP